MPSRDKEAKMKIAINILLGLAAAVLLNGVIGEKDAENKKSITFAFMAMLAFIMFANGLMM